MHRGSCHCGAVRYTVEGEIGKAIECNCSHCQRKGYLLWFVPRASVAIESGEDALATYTFNRHVIRHRFCATCGCAPFGFGTAPDGTETAAVNLRCIEGIDLTGIERVPVNGREF
jgi:hypothetical protein